MISHCPEAFSICSGWGGNFKNRGFIAFGEVTELRRGFEYLSPKLAACESVIKCRCRNILSMCVPSSEGGWPWNSVKSGWSDVLSSSIPRRRVDEVRWYNVDPFRFVPFYIPNHVQLHQKKKRAVHMILSLLPFRPFCIPFIVSGPSHQLVADLAVT